MAEFRRLISYIYEYEGKVKGKNVGFVKLEARNGLCKLNVNVKKLYMGSENMGVYLLTGTQEIFLGNIFLRNGCGEFRTLVQVADVEESGESMDECYGLSIHEKKDTWRTYTTIWEDAVAQAAQIVLENVTSENAVEKEAEKMNSLVLEIEKKDSEGDSQPSGIMEMVEDFEMGRLEIETEQPDIPLQTTLSQALEKKAEKAEKEPEDTQKNPLEGSDKEEIEIKEWKNSPEPSITDFSLHTPLSAYSQEDIQQTNTRLSQQNLAGNNLFRQATGSPGLIRGVGTMRQNSGNMPQAGNLSGLNLSGFSPAEKKPSGARAANVRTPVYPRQGSRQSFPLPFSPSPAPASASSPAPAPVLSQEKVQEKEPVIRQHKEEPMIVGDPEALAKLDEEDAEKKQIPIWDFFWKTYPKIQAFDSQHGCQILVIKPQDIGLLPREIWIYGNNSFLLHGYYNYRYLILARLENPKGEPRYLLGVPGHYYSNEKYMAAMFGFPNFVLSKKQPTQDGRFGYWYTDIRLGEGTVSAQTDLPYR